MVACHFLLLISHPRFLYFPTCTKQLVIKSVKRQGGKPEGWIAVLQTTLEINEQPLQDYCKVRVAHKDGHFSFLEV